MDTVKYAKYLDAQLVGPAAITIVFHAKSPRIF